MRRQVLWWEQKQNGVAIFLRCRKSDVDTRPCDIDPDGGIGQVPTQGQPPALMTIDNNLSLFDFQPNSLLEKRGEWLPLDCQWVKWSEKGLITCPGSGPPEKSAWKQLSDRSKELHVEIPAPFLIVFKSLTCLKSV